MLAYDQPIMRSKPDAGPRPARTTAGLNVLQLAQLLWQRKTAIVFAALTWLTLRRGAVDPVCGMRVDRATDRKSVV